MNLDTKWIYIDLPDSSSTNEWKNLILIDGSSRITNFDFKIWVEIFIIFYTPLKFEFFEILKFLKN